MKLLFKEKLFNKKLGGENKNLLANFISLSALQVSNYLLPLLVFPYLIQVISIENFGLISYAQASVYYFAILADYGFQLSATRRLSIHAEDKAEVNRIYSEVFSTKLLLCLAGLVFWVGLLALIPPLQAHWQLYILSFSMVIGQVLLPVWFFQGMQQMKYITYLNVASKVLFVLLVFILIKNPSQYIYVNLIQGLTSVAGGLVSLWIIRNKFGIRFTFSGLSAVVQQIKEGWHIFLSVFSLHMYMNCNLLILGFFASATVVGYYSVAEKFIFAIRQFLGVSSQAAYPHICRLANQSHAQLLRFFRNIYLPFGVLMVLGAIALFLLADKLVFFVVRDTVPEIIFLVKVMSVVPVIVLLNIPPYQTMLAYGLKHSYSPIMTFGALLSICLNLALASQFGAHGTAYAVIGTEVFITVAFYLIVEYKHPAYCILKPMLGTKA